MRGKKWGGYSLPAGYANAAVQIFSRKAAPTKPIANPTAATTLRGRQVLTEGERAHTRAAGWLRISHASSGCQI